MLFIQDWRGVFTFQALLVLPEYYLHQPRRSHHSLQLCGPWRQWSYGSTKSVTAKKIMTVSFIGPRIFSSSSRYTVTKRLVFPHCKKKKKAVTQWKLSVGNWIGYRNRAWQHIYWLGLYWRATKTRRSTMFLVTLNHWKRVLFANAVCFARAQVIM